MLWEWVAGSYNKALAETVFTKISGKRASGSFESAFVLLIIALITWWLLHNYSNKPPVKGSLYRDVAGNSSGTGYKDFTDSVRANVDSINRKTAVHDSQIDRLKETLDKK